MSFFLNFQSDKCPGTINNNPLNGLCEKVCIQADKVFDACIKQTQLEGYSIMPTGFSPKDPPCPLTFLSARSTSGVGTVSQISVDRDDKGCSRVQCLVSIPMEILYTDENGALSFHHALSDHGYRFRRRAARKLFRGEKVFHRQRLHHRHFARHDARGHSSPVLRLLRHSARAGVLAGGLLGLFRIAPLSAGKILFEGLTFSLHNRYARCSRQRAYFLFYVHLFFGVDGFLADRFAHVFAKQRRILGDRERR